MSDHIIRKWRRDCWQEMSAGGMRVGMPHISVLCTDALRTCLEIEHLRAELAEREREVEVERLRIGCVQRREIGRLRGEVEQISRKEIAERHRAEAAEAKIDALEAERQRARLPTALVAEQADDEGLWFVATTAAEAYLQQELRRLHAAVEQGGRDE